MSSKADENIRKGARGSAAIGSYQGWYLSVVGRDETASAGLTVSHRKVQGRSWRNRKSDHGITS